MQIYEYLFAGLIVVLLLTVSTVMVATIATPTNNASDKNQLSSTAQKVMTQMMLDSGYPTSWGNMSADPTVFGLAKCGVTSRQAYELDPDKVMRLDSNNPDFVEPSDAVRLLNLANMQNQEAADYGFTLQFNETMQITIPQPVGSANENSYSFTVTSQYALPIIGAKVSATLYYIDTSAAPKIGHTTTLHGTTGYDGVYTAEFGTSITTAKILAITIDYYGAQLTKFYQITQGPSATLYQNKLLANRSEPYNIQSSADSQEILLTKNNDMYETTELAVKNIGTPNGFTLNGSPEASAVAVIAISGAAHDQLLLATRDFSHISYQTINFQNSAVPSGTYSYSLERTVVIGGSVFTATLYLWRMSI